MARGRSRNGSGARRGGVIGGELTRALWVVGGVAAEAEGTVICTVRRAPRRDLRPRAWKEMRLVAAQAHGEVRATYGATFGEVAEVGRRWGHCTKAAGWGLQSQIHVVADGAEW